MRISRVTFNDRFDHFRAQSTENSEGGHFWLHLSCEIRSGCRCLGGIFIQSCTPNSTLMTQKCSNPVSCISLAKHRLTIFASADKKIAIRRDATECQIHHRPRVAGAGERRLPHRHGGGEPSDPAAEPRGRLVFSLLCGSASGSSRPPPRHWRWAGAKEKANPVAPRSGRG